VYWLVPGVPVPAFPIVPVMQSIFSSAARRHTL